MKKNVFLLLTAFVTLNLSARTPAGGQDPGPAVFSNAPSGEKVSRLIEAKFQSQYGPLVHVSWKVIDDIYIGTFSKQGNQQDIFYYNDGETYGFGRTINKEDLPRGVYASLIKKFNGGTIEAAYEFKTPDAPTRYYTKIIATRYSVIASATEFGDITVYQKQKIR